MDQTKHSYTNQAFGSNQSNFTNPHVANVQTLENSFTFDQQNKRPVSRSSSRATSVLANQGFQTINSPNNNLNSLNNLNFSSAVSPQQSSLHQSSINSSNMPLNSNFNSMNLNSATTPLLSGSVGSSQINLGTNPVSSRSVIQVNNNSNNPSISSLNKENLKTSNYFKSSGNHPYGRRALYHEDKSIKNIHKNISENMRMAFLCSTWYILSSVGNVLNKHILTKYFPGFPTTVSFAHIISICLALPILFRVWRISNTIQPLTRRYVLRSIFPLAIGKFFSSVSSQFSISKIPVSYAHTIKASMPLFTVIITTCVFKEKHSAQVWLSLMPIVIGVAIATLTELLGWVVFC